MQVFHYLAHELKEESLFDNDVEQSLESGAVYNDFDSCPLDSLLDFEETSQFSFSCIPQHTNSRGRNRITSFGS